MLLAGLLVPAAIAPAFAQGTGADEGLPPNLAQHWKSNQTMMKQGTDERFVPPYLVVRGGEEVTLVPNPEFRAPRVERTPAQVIRTQSIPATTYVGA
jgi:hypothetical protein